MIKGQICKVVYGWICFLSLPTVIYTYIYVSVVSLVWKPQLQPTVCVISFSTLYGALCVVRLSGGEDVLRTWHRRAVPHGAHGAALPKEQGERRHEAWTYLHDRAHD